MMDNIEILNTVNQTLSYFYKHREIVFDKIQSYQEKIESLEIEISENTIRIEKQTVKQKKENNIFNLYDTSQPFIDEKKRLTEMLKQQQKEKEILKQKLNEQKKELDLINQNVISNQYILHNLTEQSEEENESSFKIDLDDVVKRLELILQLSELDQIRSKMEIQKLIKEIKVLDNE